MQQLYIYVPLCSQRCSASLPCCQVVMQPIVQLLKPAVQLVCMERFFAWRCKQCSHVRSQHLWSKLCTVLCSELCSNLLHAALKMRLCTQLLSPVADLSRLATAVNLPFCTDSQLHI